MTGLKWIKKRWLGHPCARCGVVFKEGDVVQYDLGMRPVHYPVERCAEALLKVLKALMVEECNEYLCSCLSKGDEGTCAWCVARAVLKATEGP